MQQETNKDITNLSSSTWGQGASPFRGTGGEAVLSLLVAAAENNVIGKDNQLPWNLPEDLKYFKNITWGMVLIMGRKTFESLGKPLPGRKSIVITRDTDWKYEDVEVVHSLEDAIEKAKQLGVKEIMVLGGAQIFKQVMPQASRIYITRIHHNFEGDAYFPGFSSEDWNLVKSHFFHADEKNQYSMTFEVWERKG